MSHLRHPACVLLALAVASPAGAAERTPVVIYGLVGCADLASTEYALHNGAHEANPLGQGSLTRLRRKAALGAGLYFLDRELAKTPGGKKWAWALRGVAVVGWGFVAVHNVRVARSGR